mgnify:CR=1 FL=1
MKRLAFVLLLGSLPALAGPLPALRADTKAVTASGLSSGGYLAVQLHVAHSRQVKGVGVIAGGPYYCAQGSLWTALYNCMTPGAWSPLPSTALLKEATDALAKAKRIDPNDAIRYANDKKKFERFVTDTELLPTMGLMPGAEA